MERTLHLVGLSAVGHNLDGPAQEAAVRSLEPGGTLWAGNGRHRGEDEPVPGGAVLETVRATAGFGHLGW